MIERLISPRLFKFVYIIVAIISFGHAWPNIMPITELPVPIEYWYFKAIFTTVTALFWPLYWSIWIWN
jgi:hypothetical protein